MDRNKLLVYDTFIYKSDSIEDIKVSKNGKKKSANTDNYGITH